MRLLILLSVIGLCNAGAYSQSAKYKSYKYTWPAANPAPIPVSEQFKDEDAVILQEKCIYNKSGNRVPSYYSLSVAANYFFIDEGSSGNSPVVKRYLRIKFLTDEGVKKFGRFILPSSFDPQFDLSCVRKSKQGFQFLPVGSFECIRYFVARKVNPDGTTTTMAHKDSISTFEVSGSTGVNKFYNWFIYFPDLKAGDELEIDYSYEGAYNYGETDRIFFHSDIPKQSVDFTFRVFEKETHILTYHNGCQPYDSVMTTKTSPHYTEYYFHYDNLPACTDEVNARLHLELPHFTFYRHRHDFGISNASQYIVKPLPYPWSYIMLPFVNYRYQDLKLRLSRADATTQTINQLTEQLKSESKDSSTASLTSCLHHLLAEEFDYEEDHGYTGDKPHELEMLGKNIKKKVLKEQSRLRIYDELLLRTEKPYYHALMMDKRIARFDMERFESINACRLGIVVPFGKDFIFFYPKSSRFGYETNELPFYYEGITSFLIPQAENWEKQSDLVPYVEFMYINTPGSGIEENTRNTACMIQVSLDSKKVDVNARIKLAGQFSTLTRGYYKYGSVDTTINPNYYRVIADMADDQQDMETNIQSSSKYPFETSVNQKFTANGILKENAASEYTIDLKDCFNNVIEDRFTSKGRDLTFFTDFICEDAHRYMMQFDHKVRVDNAESFLKKINNTFASYEFRISQPADNSILLESNYAVKTPYVLPGNANDVDEVYAAIRSLGEKKLLISKLD